jgi:TetR/AcrR family transcriptional regulator, transcriptional repressor for nem operon
VESRRSRQVREPGGLMSRTKPAEQRRSDLLGSASELFVDKGIAATTLEEITDRAGVSKGLFYVYFHSKDGLVSALQENFSEQFAKRLFAAAAAETQWAKKLDACVQTGFESYREWRDLHDVLFHRGEHRANSSQDRRSSHLIVVDALRDLLESGVAAGVFEVGDPGSTATLLYVAMQAFDPTICGSRPPSDEKVVRATKELFRRAVGLG